MKLHHALIAAAAALTLSACGGGDSHEAPAPEAPRSVPTSAVASPRAYTEFAASLERSETGQPLSVDTVAMPPTSETEAPLAL